MADLSQGQSASVVLGAGETVRVTASGTTTVRGAYGAPSSTTTLTANFQDFGPYGVPAKLEVVAVSGGCSYVTVQGQPVTLTPAEVAAGLKAWTGTAAENAALRAMGAGFGTYSPYLGQELLTIVVGNSIAAACRWSGTVGNGWTATNEILAADRLAGSPLVWGEYTSNAQMDKYGVYGYSGKRLDEILSDMPTNLYAPVGTAKPQIVIANALTENDIIQDATAGAIISRLKQFVADVRSRWPQAVLVLGTPHPCLSVTASQSLVYSAVRDYMLSLENGSSIRVYRNDGYEDPTFPGKPLAGYTDATVHPNHKGATVNARALAAVLRSITGGSVMRVVTRGSANFSMAGSASITATNVSGTAPSSGTHTGFSAGTLVSLAEQPGWLLTLTQAAGQAADTGLTGLGSVAISGGASTRVSSYADVEVVSGAENLRFITLSPRINDGSGNNYQYTIKPNTLDANGEYKNGDRLMMRSPWMAAASGNITAVQPYINYQIKTQDGISSSLGGIIVIRVLSAGVDTLVA